MATFIAHRKANTGDLPEVAKIGYGGDYSSADGGNNPGGVDMVDYFDESKTGAPDFYHALHVRLIGGLGDLALGGGTAIGMTVTSIDVWDSGSAHSPPFPNPVYEISGLSIRMTDIWADAGPDGRLDSIPSAIFGHADLIAGSPFNDRLIAYDGNDVVRANGGNDLLDGGRGNDKLIGGPGRDRFDFTAAPSAGNLDKMVDFVHGADLIGLDIVDFGAVHFSAGSAGVLPGNFRLGTRALDPNDHLIYDRSTGALYYDRDGSGSAYAQHKFAILENHAALSASDFYPVP